MYQRTIEELQKDEREKVIIDIRREADFLRETYPGAKHIYWEEFEAHKDEVPKDRPVYLICYTGERSDELARELLEEGYEAVSYTHLVRSMTVSKSRFFSAMSLPPRRSVS